jgi:hypothetical protein
MPNDIDWDKEFADDPDYQAMTPAQRKKLLSVMEKMIDMGMAAVFGEEDDGVPDAQVDCEQCILHCKAKCCTMVFALTKAEVKQGHIKYNSDRPYFIARDQDGYCPHMDRQTYRCMIWENRPLRCRRYDCRNDSHVWPRGIPTELAAAFPNLSTNRNR